MRGLYKRGKTYYIDFSYKGKRVREPAGESFSLAQALLSRRKAEVIDNFNKRIVEPERIKFKDFADLYLEEHAKVNNSSWKSTELCLKQVKAFFGDKFLDEVTVNDIERYKAFKRKVCAPATVNRHLSHLKSLFNKAKNRWNYLSGDNPVKKVGMFRENNERNRFLTSEELQNLLACSNPFLRLIILVAVNTGMRKGEIENLQWTQVDFSNKIIYLIKTKGDKKREIPINDTVEWVLLQLKENKSKWVFSKDNGEKYGDCRKAFENAVARAKIENFKFHDLRHTFASHLVMNGKDLYTVQQLLGHSTSTMTQRYSHLSMEHKREAVQTLGTLNVTIASQGLHADKRKNRYVAPSCLKQISSEVKNSVEKSGA